MRAPAPPSDAPGLYAFVIEDAIVYVGLATLGISRRLRSYETDDPRERKQRPVTSLLGEALADGQQVKVFVATPEVLDRNGVPVDVAAGLETALIARARPWWNFMLQGIAEAS
jgi:hypothetical protein